MTDVIQADRPVEDSAHGGSSDRTYVLVALFLAVMTAIEVAAYELKEELGSFYDVSILSLMVVKFGMVIAYFMHLKNDPKMCRRVFGFGLGVALLIFTGMLSTFHFWAPGYR